MTKQTAVEFLNEKFTYIKWMRDRDEISSETGIKWYNEALKQAKAIEKEQMQVTSDSIVENVVVQFRERSQTGIKKYGTTLDRNDLTTKQWLHHLQEELMDAVNYIEKLKQIL